MAKNKTEKKEFTVYWTENHRGTIQASNLKEAERIAGNGLENVKEHPRHIIVDNIYVEK